MKWKNTLRKKIKEERIDNLFFSKKDKKNIDLDQLSIYLHGHTKYFASYTHELFPGMHLLPKDKSFPTIVLFRTGSFTLMGSKNLNAIFESEAFVESIIDMFKKKIIFTASQGPPFVSNMLQYCETEVT